MTTRTPLMAGNWKMNLNHLEAIAHVQKLAFALADKDYEAVEVAVLPPFTDLRSVQTLVDGDKLKIKYGAQDISQHDSGAYTGEISGPMLAKLKCTYVVIGHSERRQYHHETDEVVNAKVKAALAADLIPIMCVGESLEQRETGITEEWITMQIKAGLNGVAEDKIRKIVIAYEPIWAIGTGKTATPEQAEEVCEHIRTVIRKLFGAKIARATSILYGGSMNEKNAYELLAQPDIDGGLIGGASLVPEKFVKIIEAANQPTA